MSDARSTWSPRRAVLSAALALPTAGTAQAQAGRRLVTVPDMIEMSRIAGHNAYTVGVHRPGIISSTGDRLVFVVERGDLARNAVHASLLLFRADQLFGTPRHDTVLTRTSTTNRAAIGAVQWFPGDTFRTWQRRIPTLAADCFKAPVLIEAIAWPGGRGALAPWELFTRLRRLGKPVEMFYYPDGAHNLLKPASGSPPRGAPWTGSGSGSRARRT